MQCKECGKTISKGHLCNDCKLKIARQLKTELKQTSDPTLKDLKAHPGMYSVKLKHKR